MFRKMYNKTIELAGSKNSKFFLGGLSFIESFIFPIPPDVIIIPMTIAKPKKWIKIAFIATLGSVLGAILGYFIGYVFFNEIGVKIFELYGVDNASFLKDKVSSVGLEELIRGYADLRHKYYRKLKHFKTFGRGWTRRVNEVEETAIGMIEK